MLTKWCLPSFTLKRVESVHEVSLLYDSPVSQVLTRGCPHITSAARGGKGVGQILTIADGGGRGVSQMLTIVDEGG